jgi:hypothetical protein
MYCLIGQRSAALLVPVSRLKIKVQATRRVASNAQETNGQHGERAPPRVARPVLRHRRARNPTGKERDPMSTVILTSGRATQPTLSLSRSSSRPTCRPPSSFAYPRNRRSPSRTGGLRRHPGERVATPSLLDRSRPRTAPGQRVRCARESHVLSRSCICTARVVGQVMCDRCSRRGTRSMLAQEE